MPDGIEFKTPKKKKIVSAPVRKNILASAEAAKKTRPTSSEAGVRPSARIQKPLNSQEKRRPRPDSLRRLSEEGAAPKRRPQAAEPSAQVAGAPQLNEKEKYSAEQPVRRPRPVTAGIPNRLKQEKSLESLGRLLKTKREIQGLTRRDVVVKIKIPLDQLEAIEEGRLSSLPPVFAKGFLRAYANELSLDAENILDDYRHLTGGFKNEASGKESSSINYVEASLGKPSLGKSFKLFLTMMAAFIVVISLTFWLVPGLRYRLASSVPPLKNVPGFSEIGEDKGPVETISLGEKNDFLPDPIPLREGSNINNTIPVQEVGGNLVLQSHMDKVWVEVRVDGEQKKFLWMANGQEETFQAKNNIVLTTGQATALTANWNGRDFKPLSTAPVVKMVFPPGATGDGAEKSTP